MQPFLDPFQQPKRQSGEPGLFKANKPVQRIKTPRIAKGAAKKGIREKPDGPHARSGVQPHGWADMEQTT